MKLNDKNYEIIENIKEAYDEKEVKEKMTDYFTPFDYVVGDWAYGKLRLKGFYDKTNKNKKNFNDIENVKKYIEENCAYGCKYFILKKID